MRIQIKKLALEKERALLSGNNNKPANLLIPNWPIGRDTALDVTVFNPLTPSRLA